MKQIAIGLAVLVFFGAIIFAAGSASGRDEAKAAKAETREIQKQIDKDATNTEEAKKAVEEKEAALDEVERLTAKVERQREEIKSLKAQLKAQEAAVVETAPPTTPPPADTGSTPIPIPRGEDDDINVPGFLCPTRFC